MDKAALLAIADRVEALTGPDRGVDADIVLFICRGATVGHYTADDDGDIVFHAAAIGIRDKSTCPHFTASLDAAMTLVPGTTIAASFDWPPGIEGATCGAVLTLVTLEGTRDVKAVSCTPAAALTAAALRAIAGGEDA